MKFLVPNYSCLQNPWPGGCRPQIPVLSVLCPQLNLLNPPPNKIPGYASGGSVSTVPVTNLTIMCLTINSTRSFLTNNEFSLSEVNSPPHLDNFSSCIPFTPDGPPPHSAFSCVVLFIVSILLSCLRLLVL